MTQTAEHNDSLHFPATGVKRKLAGSLISTELPSVLRKHGPGFLDVFSIFIDANALPQGC